MAKQKLNRLQTTGVAFRARRTTTLTTPANSQTTNFVFNTADYNYGSGYSTSTGLFTAPYNGVYHFTGSWHLERTYMTRAFLVTRGTVSSNSKPRTVDNNLGSGGNQSRLNWAQEIYMAAGENIGWDIWTGAATDVGGDTTETWVSGHMVMGV